MNKSLRLAALLLVLAGSAPLFAQSYRSFRDEYDDIRTRARVRFGPLRILPSFRLTEVGRDSNVYFREDGGEVVPDFTATLSPEVRGYWLLGRSAILSVTENPEYLFHAKEEALRAFSNSYSSGLRLLLLRRFSLGAEYHVRSHVRRSTSELDRRIRDTARGATGGFFLETPRGTALGFTGSLDDFRYKDVAAGLPEDVYARALDRRETKAGFEVYYRVFSMSALFARAEYGRYDFASPESAWRDGSSVDLSGGLRFPVAGRARGTISLGWKSFRPDSAERRAFRGIVAATDVAFRAGRFGFSLGYDRDTVFSYLESAYYYVDSRVRAGLSIYLTASFRVDGSVDMGNLSYPEPQEIRDGTGTVVVDRRRDVYRNFSVGPVLRITGRAGLGLTYNFYRRTSNVPGFKVRRDFVGAFLTYEF